MKFEITLDVNEGKQHRPVFKGMPVMPMPAAPNPMMGGLPSFVAATGAQMAAATGKDQPLTGGKDGLAVDRNNRLNCKISLDISAEEMKVCRETNIKPVTAEEIKEISSAISDAWLESSQKVSTGITTVQLEQTKTHIESKMIELDGKIKLAIARIAGTAKIAVEVVKHLKEQHENCKDLDKEEKSQYDDVMRDVKIKLVD